MRSNQEFCSAHRLRDFDVSMAFRQVFGAIDKADPPQRCIPDRPASHPPRPALSLSHDPFEHAITGRRSTQGELKPDPAQEAVLPHFDRIALQGLNPPAPPVKARLLPQGGVDEQVQGLYLWGGVGRGKSMLMDLFGGQPRQDIPSRRVHFHAFMQ